LTPFKLLLKGTLIRTLAASILAAGISLGMQTIIGDSDSNLINLGLTSGILLVSGGFVIPWILPEIRELLTI
jgi:hypothetical protein